MVDLNPIISIITLGVNRLKTQIKRQRQSKWIKKKNPNIYCLEEMYFKYKDTG